MNSCIVVQINFKKHCDFEMHSAVTFETHTDTLSSVNISL